ncbi:protein of unknown function [Alcaligenes faecalis subsp. faecalis]|nr:protein of unknown function [Alcaligenes faecalis subsp. faecalis]
MLEYIFYFAAHLDVGQKQKKQYTVVTVAQLVESRIVIPVVVGSSPIGHPRNLPLPRFCRSP